MKTSEAEEGWLEHMPESFQVLWIAARERGAIDGEIEDRSNEK